MTAQSVIKDENVVWHQHTVTKKIRSDLKSKNRRCFGLLDYRGQVNQPLQVH